MSELTLIGRELPPPGVSDRWLECLIGLARGLPGYSASPSELAGLRHAIESERARRARLIQAGRLPARLPRCPAASVPTPEEIVGEILACAFLGSVVAGCWQAVDAAIARAARPPEPVRQPIRRSTYRRRMK
jgi:hypothetical protein